MEAAKLDNLNKDPSLLYKPLCFAKKALFFVLWWKKKEIENETTGLKYKTMTKENIWEKMRRKKNNLIKKIWENLSKVDLDGEKERFILKTISTKESLEKLVRSLNDKISEINIKLLDQSITKQEEKIYKLKKQKQELEEEIEKIVSMKKIVISNGFVITKKNYKEIKNSMTSINPDKQNVIEEINLELLAKNSNSNTSFVKKYKILSKLKKMDKDLHKKYMKSKEKINKQIERENKELSNLKQLQDEIKLFSILEYKYIVYIHREINNMKDIINTFQKNKVNGYVACNKYSFQKLKYVNHILETLVYCKNKDIYNFLKSLSEFI